MAEKPKKDPIEEVHFRVDELVRELADLGKIADSVPALVNGGVAVLQASLDAKIDKLLASQVADDESDKAVVESNRAVVESNRMLSEKIDKLVTTLLTPTTRTATLTLPSGPATMTVREGREKFQ